jgi:hypothetical protein
MEEKIRMSVGEADGHAGARLFCPAGGFNPIFVKSAGCSVPSTSVISVTQSRKEDAPWKE